MSVYFAAHREQHNVDRGTSGETNMTKLHLGVAATACTVATLLLASTGVPAQEVKEKPRLYTYVSNWIIPRAKWADMDKGRTATQKVFEQAMSDGTLVGFGSDKALVHTAEGSTHDAWWSSMSEAGLLKVLEEVYKTGGAVTPVLESATKHWDGVYESRYYNWKSGELKGAYTHAATYKFKADAPNDALDLVARNFAVPMFEKLIADGTVLEYEIDEEAIHTESPNKFFIVYITATAEGQDKVNAALREALKGSPFAGPAFGSMVDFEGHRDDLSRTEGVYK